MRELSGLRAGSRYLLVKITPPLVSRFEDGPVQEFDPIILSVIGPGGLNDVGIRPVSVEIVLCPNYTEGAVDERKCSRIGTGGLHATYADALRHFPAEERNDWFASWPPSTAR
jgi:hypothetical protein